MSLQCAPLSIHAVHHKEPTVSMSAQHCQTATLYLSDCFCQKALAGNVAATFVPTCKVRCKHIQAYNRFSPMQMDVDSSGHDMAHAAPLHGKPHKGRQVMEYYANLLMKYEWMVGVPVDLGPAWRVLARPEGKRCLMIASRCASSCPVIASWHVPRTRSFSFAMAEICASSCL